jgi:hypothetical protein
METAVRRGTGGGCAIKGSGSGAELPQNLTVAERRREVKGTKLIWYRYLCVPEFGGSRRPIDDNLWLLPLAASELLVQIQMKRFYGSSAGAPEGLGKRKISFLSIVPIQFCCTTDVRR